MTIVHMNSDLLAYQEEMKNMLRQIIQQNFIAGVQEAGRGELPFVSEKLLPSPQILAISLEQYEGHAHDFIGIVALHDFGIHAMDITIQDDQGNLIERGPVIPYPDDPELWEYVPTACVPSGTFVIVQVVATDCMGGVAVSREYKTIP